METATEPNNRHNFWLEQMTAWKQSGLSGAKFCQANDLSYHQFVYWRQKLHKGEHRPTGQEKHGGFTQVLRQAETTQGLSLSLPNGLVLRGIGADNITVVRQLLDTL